MFITQGDIPSWSDRNPCILTCDISHFLCTMHLTDCSTCLQFTEAVVNLKFDEEPKYAAYSALFEPLCGTPAARPVLQTDAPKVFS